jgi:hypothetical protein
LIKLVWLRWKVQEWLVLVLPKTFECCHKKMSMSFLLLKPPQNIQLYRNSKFRCRHFETAINKAFEVEILQNKIKPCIVENLCIIALVGENMKIIKGWAVECLALWNNVNIRAIAQGARE